MSTRKKIFIFPVPAIGHSNPILKLANEFIKNCSAEVVMYSLDKFKTDIEAIGAEFRLLSDKKYEDLLKELNLNNNSVDLIENLFTKQYNLVNECSFRLAQEIDRDKPDLVLFDSFSLHAKFAMKILRENYKRLDQIRDSTDPFLLKPTSKPPLAIVYWTTFTNDEKIYPNEYEKQYELRASWFEKLSLIYVLFKLSILAKNVSKKFQLPYKGPVEDFVLRDANEFNIVFTFPELHPRAHLFDNKTTFVGSCIVDEVHINGETNHKDENLDKILSEHSILDDKGPRAQTKKLIYVSLGTAFNSQNNVFSIIIDSFNIFDELISKNEDAKLSKFNQLIKEKKMKIPDNMLLAPSLPQLEVLKRASLFITHSGMNSTSESVHYGVPMICIPQNGDQPLNAYRVAIELGLGLFYDYKTLTAKELISGIHKIFADSTFYSRCQLYSNLSKQYVGHKIACKRIMEIIN